MQTNNSSATDRVAIVGAGIAGSAASYFACAAVGSDLSVVVFEQGDQIGGRIQHRPVADAIVETGATLMHSSNAYLSEFIDELGLKKDLPDPILTTKNPRLWCSSVGRLGTSSTTRQPIYNVGSLRQNFS
jgi:oxygen-dependent protoporphyrinogen oxidase